MPQQIPVRSYARRRQSKPLTSSIHKRSYNALSRMGVVFEDPPALVYLEGVNDPDAPYGATLHEVHDTSSEEIIEYLVMRARGVGMMEAAKWVEKNRPVLVVEFRHQKHRMSGSEGLK